MKIFIVAIVTLVILIPLVLFYAWTPTSIGEEIQNLSVNIVEHKYREGQKLNIVSWNIAWGYGMGSEGTNYEPKDKDHFKFTLDSMAEVLKDMDADIVLLQEVDFDSSKSHNIDQVKYLSEKLGMNRAYAVSWNHKYIPFPYWPPSNHFKQVVSGGAILSKYKINSTTTKLWPKPESNAWWYNLFYLYRYTQTATINLGSKQITVVNSHLEAFDGYNRMAQANSLKEMVSGMKGPLIFGGDFNTTPTGAVQKSGFVDNGEDNYETDKSYELISSIPFIKDSLGMQEYLMDENKWFTFPSTLPNRKLDYLFASEEFEVEEFTVEQTPESDHLPVKATLRLVNFNN